MRAAWLAALALAGALGCSKRVIVSHRPMVPATGVADTMNRQIANAVDAGDGDIGARILRERLNAEPDNVAIRLQLAERYKKTGFPDIAIEHYRLAAERFPHHESVHVTLMRELREQRYHAEALAVLERYLDGHPASGIEVHAWLGILHDELGDWKAGEAAHRQAIGRTPTPKAYLHNNLGQNLLLQKKNAEAAEQFAAALRLDPGSAIARNNLGVALAEQPEEAMKQWASVGDAAAAHTNMAAVLIEHGQYQDARQQLHLALGYKPDHSTALTNLALLAELDGGDAVVEPQQRLSFWKRVTGAIGKVILTPEEKPRGAEPVHTNGTTQASVRK